MEKSSEHVYQKLVLENVHQKLVPDPFFILVNNPKQQLLERNSFKMRYFKRGYFSCKLSPF